jgi:hypothetical protein
MHSVEAKAYGIVDHILGDSNDVIHRLPDGTMNPLALAHAGMLIESTNGAGHG